VIEFNKKDDIPGRVIIKLHYLKLNTIAFFCTLVNRIVWLIKGVNLSSGSRFNGFSKVFRFPGSTITIGGNCKFISDKSTNLIGVNRKCIISTHSNNAIIKIGNGSGFSGVSIGCLQSITIGDDVLVGANVIITDYDWHNIDPSRRAEKCLNSKPIIIEDNVFIGVNSIVWKGVTIGKNSVIGANSVVTKSVPSGVIAAGNPCKVIRDI